MKVWRLVAGIISIALCGFVLIQSCAAGLSNAIEENGEVSGSAGLIVAIGMLVGGIVSICVRKCKGKGGSIALAIIFGIPFIIGICNFGSFSDLAIWSVWCLANAVLAIVTLFLKKKEEPGQNSLEE